MKVPISKLVSKVITQKVAFDGFYLELQVYQIWLPFDY
jgi:hypothetical protein